MERIGKYEVVEVIARNNGGTVYRALSPQVSGYVALKEINSTLATYPDMQRRFQQEGGALVGLPPHPNLVPLRDAFVLNGRFFMAWDFVEGSPLADLIGYGNVSPARGTAVLDNSLAGLEALNRHGFTHQNLKPWNVLVDQAGIARLTDYGINQFKSKDRLFQARENARCAAPELIDPAAWRGGTDEQVDLYALGMLSYSLLLGEQYFRSAFPEVYSQAGGSRSERWLRWHADPARAAPNLHDFNPRIPRELAGVIGRMMAKDTKDRYRSATDARRDLAAALQGAQDARGSGRDRPPENETIQLDLYRERMRGGGRPAVPPPLPPQPQRGGPPRPPAGQGPAPVRAGRRIPTWAWLVGGVAALALIGFVLFYVLLSKPGYTAVIKGAPPGSEVYVDNVRRGIPQPNGDIRIEGLRAGPHAIRVTSEGFEDFPERVTGKDGEVKNVPVSLVARGAAPSGLPKEIDYKGPMVFIPAGEFIMGSDSHRPNEKPAHKVTLPDYYLDKFEVTNAQYKQFCDETRRPYPQAPFFDPNYFAKSDYPVVGVNFNDVTAYAQWAGKRLPTEQEWEKAASWGPGTPAKRQYPWGNDFDQTRVALSLFTKLQEPGPVGQKPPGVSAYGVHDLAGNATEWTGSNYQPYPGNPTPDPEYGAANFVIRGGHFDSETGFVRTTVRVYHPPGFVAAEERERAYLIGFRCAIAANDPRLQEFLRARGGR